MKGWGFCGATYQSQSPNIDAEDAINLYCERSESSGAKTPIALLRTPGTKIFATVPEASIPGLFTVNGRTFAAAKKLYELGIGSGPVVRGDLLTQPLGPTQLIANETQLLILNNGKLFVLTLAGGAFNSVDMTQFDGPVMQIGFADGYGIAVIQNSHTFQVSNLEDFTTWDGLNISRQSLFPDNYTSMICDHREIWLFSGKKSQAYYNAGAGFPPFIPIQGAFIEDGAAAAFATAQLDNSIFWLAQDDRGWLVAKRANGYVGQRISTHAVEYAWQQYPIASDAVAYTYQEGGHGFWVIRFPTANATWVYDVATGFWHKRGFWQQTAGTYSAHRSTSHTFNFGKHLVGDWASGTVYEMSSALNDDFGNPLRWLRTSPTIAHENKRIEYPEFELDIETGLGTIVAGQDSQGQDILRAPQVALRWSNDATKTWGPTFQLSCGKTGQYTYRARKVMLGTARKRVFQVFGSDPVPTRIADAYLDARPLAS